LYFLPDLRIQIVALFGEIAYQSEFELNSKLIAEKIYANPDLRISLNQIIHPAVAKDYQQWLSNQNHPYILKVAALIFEADIYKNMNLNILVLSPQASRISRVLERDPQRGKEQIEKIIQSQMTDEEKSKLADMIINNDESKSLIKQVLEIDTLVKRRLH